MNNKGFTLVELLATIVILGIVMGIVIISVNANFSGAKDKSEEIFIETIKDAVNIYLSSDAKELDFSVECVNDLVKSNKTVKVYKVVSDFDEVINSTYHPITQNDLVNPANEDVLCADAGDIELNIYRDDDYVYYYSINKSEFNRVASSSFFLNTDDMYISNLPEGYGCE